MAYLPPSGGRMNISMAGNMANAASSISTGTFVLSGGSNVTLSQNGNSINIAAATNALTSQSNQALSGSNGSFAFQTATFGNSNGLSFYTTNGSMVGSYTVPTQSVQTVGMYATGAQTIGQSSSSTFDARSLNMSGQGAFSLGMSGNTIQLSAPNSSSLSATGIVSMSANGATLSIGAPAFSAGMSNLGNTRGTSGTNSNQLVFAGSNGIVLSQSSAAGGNTITINGQPALSRFEYAEGLFSSIGAMTGGSLSLNHLYIPFNVTGTAAKIGGSLSASTNTSATTASINLSLWMGIYTLTGSTLSLMSSGSANNGFQWSQSASTTANTSINSMREMTVPMNVNITPGEYWMAAVVSSASTYTGIGFTMYGNAQIVNGATNAVLTPIGSNTSVARDAMLFQGIYTANTSAGPATIVSTNIDNTAASNVLRANFYNVIYNATY